MKINGIVCIVAIFGIAAGCSKKDDTLKGTRIDVRVPLSETADMISDESDETISEYDFFAIENKVLPVSFQPPSNYAAWTHVNGNPSHAINHPALPRDIRLIWAESIGKGNSRSQRITASPVSGNGMIFTMDSQSTVSAFSLTGQKIWTAGLVPIDDKSSDASSGGLAFGSGLLFATTGYGALHAINPESGAIVWTQRFAAAPASSPTVSDGKVYVVTSDGKAYAIDVANGKLMWRLESVSAPASLSNEVAPAVFEDLAVFPFNSGELIGAGKDSGVPIWSAWISGSSISGPRATLRGISGSPVISNGILYAANQSGRMAALDFANGQVLWSFEAGSYNAVWPTSDSVYLVSDDARLVRLDLATGNPVWAVDLPEFKKKKIRRRKAVFANYGPLLAGGRLIVASSDGLIRHFSPESGELIGTTKVDGGAASPPIVVNGILYVVTEKGRLLAFGQ